jgi:hypothetical protein
MKNLTIGARLNDEGEIEFFGMDEVNAAIQGGARVAKVEEGQVLVEEIPEEYRDSEDEEDAGYSLAGFEIVVTLE